MLSEAPLYEDEQLMITINENPEEHLFWIKKPEEKYKCAYVLQRGCLKDFALTERGKLESRLNNYNSEIWANLTLNNLTINEAHIAILQAYTEDRKRIFLGYLNDNQ